MLLCDLGLMCEHTEVVLQLQCSFLITNYLLFPQSCFQGQRAIISFGLDIFTLCFVT